MSTVDLSHRMAVTSYITTAADGTGCLIERPGRWWCRALMMVLLLASLRTVGEVWPAWAAASQSEDFDQSQLLGLALLAAGPLTYVGIRLFYRNQDARHRYETETESRIDDLQATDQLESTQRRSRHARLPGANANQMAGNTVDGSLDALEKTVSNLLGRSSNRS